MAYLYRLIVAMLALLAGYAFAVVPVAQTWRVQADSYNAYPQEFHPSKEAACAALFAVAERNYPNGWGSPAYAVGTSGGIPVCNLTRFGSTSGYPFTSGASACPANSVLVPGTNSCACDPGFVEENGQCKYTSTGNSCNGLSDFCSGLKGEKINLEGKGTATPPGCSADSQRPNCAMGCAGEAVGMGVSYKTSDGSWMTGQEYRITGGTCTLPQPSDVPQKKESDCAGSVGEVNGIRTCVPNQAATGDTSSKETKNPDGTSTNTESKTTCENGVCKTTNTTTTKDAAGNTTSTSTSSSTTSQREYCASNKASTVCAATNGDKNPSDKDGSDKGEEKCEGDDCEDKPGKFEGSCMAGFTCEGDALQCAQTREQHRRNCELFEKDSDSNSLTNKALNGTDDKSADALKASAGQVNVSSTFDQSGLGWSHSCPADPRIPLGFGGSNSEFSIPFSRICGPLGVLSLAGVGITLLGCGVWVLGGKKGS